VWRYCKASLFFRCCEVPCCIYRSPTFLGSACGLVTIEAMKEGGKSINITNARIRLIYLWIVAFIDAFGI